MCNFLYVSQVPMTFVLTDSADHAAAQRRRTTVKIGAIRITCLQHLSEPRRLTQNSRQSIQIARAAGALRRGCGRREPGRIHEVKELRQEWLIGVADGDAGQ